MDKRIKTVMPPAGIFSLVFTALGALYLLLGILCISFPTDAEDKTVGIIFSCLGIVFLLTALIALLILIGGQKKKNKVQNSGNYLYGEVVDVVPYGTHYSYRPVFTVLTRYIDSQGTIHIFRTPNLKSYPDRSILGRKVKVFYQDDSFKQYYVDLESGFPRIIEH